MRVGSKKDGIGHTHTHTQIGTRKDKVKRLLSMTVKRSFGLAAVQAA